MKQRTARSINPRSGRRLQRAPASVEFAGALLLVTALASSIEARILEDFTGTINDPEPSNSIGMRSQDGQLVLEGYYGGETDPILETIQPLYDVHPFAAPVVQVSADLVESQGGENVFVVLCLGQPDHGYLLLKSSHEAMLVKANGPPEQWTLLARCHRTYAIPHTWNENAKLRLVATPRGDTTEITAWAIRDDGRVEFRADFVDGPGSDIGVPSPLPHGIAFQPDPGPPLDGLTVTSLGLAQVSTGFDRAGYFRLDNLAADFFQVPHFVAVDRMPDPDHPLLLSYSGDTAGPHIILNAYHLQDEWSLMLEPIVQHQGHPAMPADCQPAMRAYRVMPGFGLSSDFSGNQPPWVRVREGGAWPQLTQSGGVLRLTGNSAGYGFLNPPEPYPIAWNSISSVDLLDWQVAGSYLYVGLISRVSATGSQGYTGTVGIRPGGGELRIAKENSRIIREKKDIVLEPNKAYRLTFENRATSLVLQLHELDASGDVVRRIARLQGSDTQYQRAGYAAGVYYAYSGTMAFTVDNYFAVGAPMGHFPCD